MSSERHADTLEPRLDAVDALPRSLAPGRDLWPGIEGRLAARPQRGPGRPYPRRWAVVSQLAAAVALMVLGGALSQILWPAGAGLPGPAVDGDIRLAAEVAELEVAEGEYLRAKEALWLAAYGRRDDLSPATLRVVEKNLVIVDQAIRELRQALEEDPGNHRLEGLLYANHRRSIDLLQRLTQASQEI